MRMECFQGYWGPFLLLHLFSSCCSSAAIRGISGQSAWYHWGEKAGAIFWDRRGRKANSYWVPFLRQSGAFNTLSWKFLYVGGISSIQLLLSFEVTVEVIREYNVGHPLPYPSAFLLFPSQFTWWQISFLPLPVKFVSFGNFLILIRER